MRRTGRTPIDDDAEKAETKPLEASMPLSIKGTLNWQQYLSEKGKNAGKWSREGKNRPESDVFFSVQFSGEGTCNPR